MKKYIDALVNYALTRELIGQEDRVFARNALLQVMEDDGAEEAPGEPEENRDGLTLCEILEALTEIAVKRGITDDNSVARELFDTKLMGALVPFPREVRRHFEELYQKSPEAATDWYYEFSKDTNYIRRDRMVRDLRWKYPGKYGELDITVNLSKPEKDPRAIAAAKLAPQSGYPRCLLCAENEGYAGRMNHPARQNHRLIPLTLAGEEWYLQYSPYVYFNEHCIVFNGRHTPMKIDRAAFDKLLEFTARFPHYFVGSNADLPIVGGSILSHDHFQGGRYEFPMAKAQIETELFFKGYGDVHAGAVNWPMPVIRLNSPDRRRLSELAGRILDRWRSYTDEAAFIFAETDGEPHNTVTPIARRRGESFELDIVLRNNITTPERPLGLYHPGPELHHIKKENIGFIEVMGLAVLPARLRDELELLQEIILAGADPQADERTAKHALWARELTERYEFTPGNAQELLRRGVGEVFERVLEDAGVYKRTPEGREAFLRFIDYVNK